MSRDARASAIAVVGAGPAGAVAACQLAALGHDTVLIHRDQPSTPRAESIPPPAMTMLDSLGLAPWIAPAVVARPRRTLVKWESAAFEAKPWYPEPAFLVDRDLFDDRLRTAARDRGVRMFTARRVAEPTRAQSGSWTIPVDTGDGWTVASATWIVDARGRRRRAGRDDAAVTAALTAAWRHGGAIEETVVEALTDSWVWGCPLSATTYSISAFLDASRLAGIERDARARLYRHLLEQSDLLARFTRGDMVGSVDVRDATPGIATELIGDGVLRVGDAAWSVDPISGHGIQCAIRSAIQGAAAVHTICTGGDVSAAAEFYVARQRGAAARAFAHTARVYRSAYRATAAFWSSRFEPASHVPDLLERPPRAGVIPTTLRLSPLASIVDVPHLESGRIVRGPALNHPVMEEPVAFFGGARVAPLLALVRNGGDAAMMVDRWAAHVPAAVARGMLAWLYSVGVLE